MGSLEVFFCNDENILELNNFVKIIKATELHILKVKFILWQLYRKKSKRWSQLAMLILIGKVDFKCSTNRETLLWAEAGKHEAWIRS